MFTKAPQRVPVTSEDPGARQLSLDEIQNLKTAANNFFNDGKYSQAIIGYSYAIQQLVQMIVPASKRRNGENPCRIAMAFRETSNGANGSAAARLGAVLYSNRAQAYLRLDKYEKAAIDADAASILDPTMFKAWYRKAVAMNSQDKHYEAMMALKQAVKLDPSSEEAKGLLEEVQFRLGRRPVDFD